VNSSESPRPLAVYLLLTFALSSIFYFLIIRAGRLGVAGGMYVVGLMWCPAAAAILTCGITGRPLRTLGWRCGPGRYLAWSYFIPLIYAAATYGVVWATGLGGFYDTAFVDHLVSRFGNVPPAAAIVFYLVFQGTIGMIFSCLTALGEEIGWRGFLVPELARRTSFTRTVLISGAIWSLWHYPVLLFADYNAGTEAWYGLLCFTVMVLGISFIFAWMRLKSDSLWTGVLLHGSHNLFIQSFFDPITKDTGRTRYIIGEFGAGLAIASILVGAYFWSRRGEVTAASARAALP
jgi:membrane protease YdiL (CAAX protease family)